MRLARLRLDPSAVQTRRMFTLDRDGIIKSIERHSSRSSLSVGIERQREIGRMEKKERPPSTPSPRKDYKKGKKRRKKGGKGGRKDTKSQRFIWMHAAGCIAVIEVQRSHGEDASLRAGIF